MVKIGFKSDELETFPGGGGWGWGAGSSETKANLAQLGLELGLSLAKILYFITLIKIVDILDQNDEKS